MITSKKYISDVNNCAPLKFIKVNCIERYKHSLLSIATIQIKVKMHILEQVEFVFGQSLKINLHLHAMTYITTY